MIFHNIWFKAQKNKKPAAIICLIMKAAGLKKPPVNLLTIALHFYIPFCLSASTSAGIMSIIAYC